VLFTPSEDIAGKVDQITTPRLREAIRIKDKLERESAIDAVLQDVFDEISSEYPEREDEVGEAFHDILRREVRAMILDEEIRPDSRRPEEIRPVSCEVAIVPRVHGSGLFTRGPNPGA